MDKNLFKENIKILESAFRANELSRESLKIYWERLQYISDEDFLNICSRIIDTEKFFPAIATFKEIQREHYPIRIYIGELEND